MAKRKPGKNAKQHHYVDVCFDTHEYNQGDGENPTDDSPYYWHGTDVIEITDTHAYLYPVQMWDDYAGYEEMRASRKVPYHRESKLTIAPEGLKVGDRVHILVERYSDGGTFGCTEGYIEVLGIYRTKAEAKAATPEKGKDHGHFGSHESYQIYEAEVE